MSAHYVLNADHTVSVASDFLAWALWFETANRRVARDLCHDGAVEVSTVFLGRDHGFTQDAPPILFETMVFGGSLNDEQERYATWGEAENGHAAMVARVRSVDHADRHPT